MQDIPQQGSITAVFLPRLIARLHRDEFEGALRVQSGALSRAIYFKRGEIASAASNAEEDRLQNILIEEGRLTSAQMAQAKSRPAGGAALGKTLIAMGLLTPSELLECARRQVRQILAACFTVRDGVFQMNHGPLPPQVTVLGLPTRRLIFDSLMRATDRQWIVREMGSMESVYRPAADMTAGLAALGLESDLEQVARGIDGVHSLREISSGTKLDDFTVSKIILALDILGLAGRTDAPAGAPLRAASRLIPIEADADAPLPLPLPEDVDAAAASVPDPPPVGDRPPTPAVEPTAAGPHAPEPPAVEAEQIVSGAGEPPPFAPGELPAFAESPADEARWSLDPRTGERIHVGPIELTFDGRVGGGSERTSRFGRSLAVAIAIILLGGGALIYLTRSRPVPEPTARRPPSREAPSDPTPARPSRDRDAGAEKTPIAETVTQAPAPAVESASPAPPETPPVAPAPAPSPPEPRPGAVAVAAALAEPGTRPIAIGTSPAPPGPQPAAIPHPLPEPATLQAPARTPDDPAGVPRNPESSFRPTAGYAEALQLLDSGEITQAAARFQKLVIDEGGQGFTLQLMIACEFETVRNVRRGAGDRGLLFVLPYSFKGRDCFRSCWGIYASADAAREAARSLPGPYVKAGVEPVVVSLARLRPPT